MEGLYELLSTPLRRSRIDVWFSQRQGNAGVQHELCGKQMQVTSLCLLINASLVLRRG